MDYSAVCLFPFSLAPEERTVCYNFQRSLKIKDSSSRLVQMYLSSEVHISCINAQNFWLWLLVYEGH
jgi:hypothetical protein